VGVLGFSGVAADPEGPIQQNSYSQRAGVEGGSVDFTGTAGVSLNHVGVYGQVEDSPPVPAGFRAGVLGAASTQPGVIGFSRDGDGIEGASFTSTAIRAVSFFGPGVDSISGALNGVSGISGTQGPAVLNTSNIAGVRGTSDTVNGVIGTSNRSIGVVGFSNNVGVFGQSTNPASFAGLFAGNVQVTGTLSAAVKNAVVPFPDGSARVLHCMESPEHWFEDFGTAKLKRGRAVVRLDADFAKVIKRGEYRVFPTPEGDCRGLFVYRKSAASFEVRELMGGRSGIAFSYRIVGRRKDIARHRRFAKIDTPLPAPSATRAPRHRKPTAAARCGHSSPASSSKPARARRGARGNSEDHARQSAGRGARLGARRSNSAEAPSISRRRKAIDRERTVRCRPRAAASRVRLSRPADIGTKIRQLKSKLAVNSWMRPRIMMLKATTMRSSLSSAVPCSTACGTWLGQINMRPFSAGIVKRSELSSFFCRYVGSRFFVSWRGEANIVDPQFFGVLT
jgi:hypothetical protein